MNAPAAITAAETADQLRHDWSRAEILALFAWPFADLMFAAQQVHRAHFDPHTLQVSTLLNIKTGGCAENCGYCSAKRASRGRTRAREAARCGRRDGGRPPRPGGRHAGRFCMGAAWRKPTDKDLEKRHRDDQGGEGRWAWNPASPSACSAPPRPSV
jgi:biotin synthase